MLFPLRDVRLIIYQQEQTPEDWSSFGADHYSVHRFHTLMSHSERVYDVGIQLDFQGVLLLMWGATIPMIYYGFICDPHLGSIYWALLSGLALACSIFTLQPRFRLPHLRPLRALTFSSFAASNILPVVHAVTRYGWDVQVHRMGLKWVVVTLFFNALGATAYALKVYFKYSINNCEGVF